MSGINTAYLSTNRGIIKILQIVCGLIAWVLLCTNWYGGKNCIAEERIGFASALNFVVVIVNIVLFILNIANLAMWKMERIYSIVASLLFLICAVLLGWYLFERNFSPTTVVASLVFTVIEFFLFLWDLKILQGESPN